MVAKRAYVPDRGDLVWLDLNPTKGHEQKGVRPALILSSKSYNAKAGLVLACPVTSHAKGYPFEVAVSAGNVEGVVLVDQIRSLDFKERHARRIAKVPARVIEEIQQYLKKLVLE